MGRWDVSLGRSWNGVIDEFKFSEPAIAVSVANFFVGVVISGTFCTSEAVQIGDGNFRPGASFEARDACRNVQTCKTIAGGTVCVAPVSSMVSSFSGRGFGVSGAVTPNGNCANNSGRNSTESSIGTPATTPGTSDAPNGSSDCVPGTIGWKSNETFSVGILDPWL